MNTVTLIPELSGKTVDIASYIFEDPSSPAGCMIVLRFTDGTEFVAWNAGDGINTHARLDDLPLTD